MTSRPEESAQLIVTKHITSIAAGASDGLVRHLTEVLNWSREIPLVSRRDPVAACERLFCQSIEIHRIAGLRDDDTVLDIGSGAGFPGVVWSVLQPSLSILLIERRARKVAFLERLVRVLPLENVEVYGGEAQTAARREAWQGRFSLAVTMAVGDPPGIMREITRLLAPGARFVSTVPRDAAMPVSCGAFSLVSRIAADHGQYVIYRSGE